MITRAYSVNGYIGLHGMRAGGAQWTGDFESGWKGCRLASARMSRMRGDAGPAAGFQTVSSIATEVVCLPVVVIPIACLRVRRQVLRQKFELGERFVCARSVQV